MERVTVNPQVTLLDLTGEDGIDEELRKQLTWTYNTTYSPSQYTIRHCGQLNTHYHQTTYPSSPQSTYDMTTDYNKSDKLLQTTRKPTGHNLPKTQESAFLQNTIPTNIHMANGIFRNIIWMAIYQRVRCTEIAGYY